MFSTIINQLRDEVNALKSVLSTNERLRNLLFPTNPPKLLTDAVPTLVTTPATVAATGEDIVDPGLTRLDWQIFDHCAAFTRLYAIYEQFVTHLITDYLRELPHIFLDYSELPDQCKTQHRVAVGQILQKWSEDGHYNTLTELAIVQGLNDGLAGKRYMLLPEAFLIDPQNYRAEILRRLFSYLGIVDCLAFVRKFQPMTNFMSLRRDTTETIETVLHDFVEHRNVTSHESVTETVSKGEIFSYADFLVLLCESLTQLLHRRILRRQFDLGRLILVGEVIHRFSNNISGVRCVGGPVTVEDDIIAISAESIFPLILRSIQSGPASLDFINLHPNQAIGFGFDRPLSVGVRLYKFPPVGAQLVNLPQIDSGSDFQI